MDQITWYLKYSLKVLMKHGYYTITPCLERIARPRALRALKDRKDRSLKKLSKHKKIKEFKQSKKKRLRQNGLLVVKSDEKIDMSMDNSH
jgi:hypothetical protein